MFNFIKRINRWLKPKPFVLDEAVRRWQIDHMVRPELVEFRLSDEKFHEAGLVMFTPFFNLSTYLKKCGGRKFGCVQVARI
jgi:hypothetical protein